jgi:hypothetical protein
MSFPEIEGAIRRVGYGDEEPKTTGEQFVSECVDWIEKWFERHSDDATLAGVKPFLFIFDPDRQTNAVLPGSKFLPSFKNSLEAAIGGKIYSSAVNLRQVYAVDSAHQTCPEMLGFLAENDLTHLFAVAVAPANRSVLVHSGSDIDSAVRISFKQVGSATFDFSHLDAFLEKYYHDFVATHEGDCDVWAEAKNRKLKQRPEFQIQRSLHGYFRHGVLPRSARVDREIQTYRGRADIRIIRSRRDGTLEGAVMELKVLFPDKSESWNLDWAKQGVDQVVGYSIADGDTVHRYVCCYDGRKADAAMPKGVDYAKEKQVAWRRYFMSTPGCERQISAFDS